jgi:PAS domain-containing protein
VRQLTKEHDKSQKDLALEKMHLDTAVSNMAQGLLLFDSEERIVLANQRYIQMYELLPDLFKTNCNLIELLQHRNAKESLSSDVDKYLKKILSASIAY